MRGARGPERGQHSCAEDAQSRSLGPDAADNLFVAIDHRVDRRIAVAAEIIDSFEPDHCRYARQLNHVAINARARRWSAEERLLWSIFRRSNNLIPANPGINDSDAVSVHRLQTA